jgi:hypothetical protein
LATPPGVARASDCKEDNVMGKPEKTPTSPLIYPHLWGGGGAS